MSFSSFFIGIFCSFLSFYRKYLSWAVIRWLISISWLLGWPWGLIFIVRMYSYGYIPGPFSLKTLHLRVWSLNTPKICWFYLSEFKRKDLSLIIKELNVFPLPSITNFSGCIHVVSLSFLGCLRVFEITSTWFEDVYIMVLQILD